MSDSKPCTLEDLREGSLVAGITAQGTVRLIKVEWIGNEAIKAVYQQSDGDITERIIFRDDQSTLSIVTRGRFWSFSADGALFRLAIEGQRIRLAHHFDPFLAIHTSRIDPLPHQITAVYERMLPKQPLRFLLADDPGAGKTIMAGLLIKELIARGDLERCLVVAPGILVEQWQDELGEKFNLEFDILNPAMLENFRSGNPFNDHNLLIARMDMLARNEELQNKLIQSNDMDLIIVDEAHRMSASYYAGEVKFTKRYQLGLKLENKTRHLLMMTATPHRGKEEDFQLFMALLDGDRFEGRFRDGVHYAYTGDLMRRLTKEELLKFDETPLFPERQAHTVKYSLSEAEAELYSEVTKYVREEMNRVERFAGDDGRKRNNVGFALQILQRRLASSPAAIFESLKRRRIRLEEQYRDHNLTLGGGNVHLASNIPDLDDDFLDELEENEYSDNNIEEMEESICASATSAESIKQLRIEIDTLLRLEAQASKVLRSNADTKWTELNKIFDNDLMIDKDGTQRKLIIFTEAKDTLKYLSSKIINRLGKAESVAVIHGGVTRPERRTVIDRFMQDKELRILIANDAAGEGVNLQRAHLMVNYDLPWNPNKIEQRFGRIHRIGQTEVCHLWNLVASDTREGEVYARLLEKLETARKALQGRVFDILGDLFEGISLKNLLWEAIQYGEQEEIKAKLFQKIDGAIDHKHIAELLNKRKLTDDLMSTELVEEVRMRIERAEAHRLQPHHVRSFFLRAFEQLGGTIKSKEIGRYEITNVPAEIREHSNMFRRGSPVQRRYERICFEKKYINQKPEAEFICPGHPLLESVIFLIQKHYGSILKNGAVMIDDGDEESEISAVFLIEHSVEDGRKTGSGKQQLVSSRLQFARITEDGKVTNPGIAPHLNLRPITQKELLGIQSELSQSWLSRDLESKVQDFSIVELARSHLDEVRERRIPELNKVETEVRSRLKKEINYWDARANELKEEEKAGKRTRQNWIQAQRRAEDMAERLQKRLLVIDQQRLITAKAPKLIGGFIVVPIELLRKLDSADSLNPSQLSQDANARKSVEISAMNAVLKAEYELGNEPEDVSASKLGYDIRSFDPATSMQRFIEVKGRTEGATTVAVTRNEIITALNKPDNYILAIVQIKQEAQPSIHYITHPFDTEPAFGVTLQHFKLAHLLSRAQRIL